MKTWEVVIEWGNGESTHVIAIGDTPQEAHKHAVKNIPALAFDNIASVEVLDEITNSSDAKAIIDLMKSFAQEGADSISFGALVWGGDNAPTVGELLKNMISNDKLFKNCKDW